MAETPPALMEMDGLTAPRLAFLFHAGLWLPAPHEKHLLPMAGSPVFAFAATKKARSKRDRASCKAFHDSASVMAKPGTELGVSDLSCLSRHHSDQLAGLLTRFRRRRTRRRTLCPFIDLTLLYMPRRQKASTIFSFRRNGRHSTVENGLTQKGTGFIGPLKNSLIC